MSQPSDFTFDDAELVTNLVTETVAPEPTKAELAPSREPQASAAAPVIVVEPESSKGVFVRLAPPLLILLAALVITSYRRTQPVHYLVPRVVPQVAAAPPVTTAPDEKIVVKATGGTEPPAVTEISKLPNPEVSPFEPEAKDAFATTAKPFETVVPFELNPKPPAGEKTAEAKTPPAPAPAAPKDPDPTLVVEAVVPPPKPVEVSNDDILKDIQREAAQKAEENKALADLKPKLQAIGLTQNLEKINATRNSYREELRKVLKMPSETAALEIDRLNAQFGKELLPEVAMAYKRLKRTNPPRMTREAEVNFMRTVGLPEPAIYEHLANALVKMMKTRGGPKDEKEVKVYAARQLLSIPVKTVRKVNLPVPASNTRPVDSSPSAVAGSSRP